jgi:hypothetical protein
MGEVAETLLALLRSPNESTRLSACREICDRVLGRAAIAIDATHTRFLTRLPRCMEACMGCMTASTSTWRRRRRCPQRKTVATPVSGRPGRPSEGDRGCAYGMASDVALD